MLSADKQYLVESRLLPVARKAGLANLAELVTRSSWRRIRVLMTAVVEAMTTNESFFFRDKTPFEHFRSTIMPALLAARRSSRSIRIWCAAAATGQEPYSLAMCLKEIEAEIAGWRIELLATDLSGEVLEKARSGLYTQFEVQRGLPIQLLIRHFAQIGELWQIAPELRAMVRYRQLNLLADFTQLGTLRSHLLPQRTDLFRPGDQDRRAQPAGTGHRERRLSRPRRRGNGGRADRSLQDGARQARPLRAEHARVAAIVH